MARVEEWMQASGGGKEKGVAGRAKSQLEQDIAELQSKFRGEAKFAS